MKTKKLIAFDLDGTLSVTKTKLNDNMADLFNRLLEKYYVAILTGGDYPQFEKLFFPFITKDPLLLSKLFILPTHGSKMYGFNKKAWINYYSILLTDEEKNTIIATLLQGIKDLKLMPQQIWGNVMEDRQTQITYSALGHDAPLEEKINRDPNMKKRIELKNYFMDHIPDFSVAIAGYTSIDIFKSGLDKTHGIQKLLDIFGFAYSDILYIGDSIYEHGNDYCVYEMGIECINVKNPQETEKIIKELL